MGIEPTSIRSTVGSSTIELIDLVGNGAQCWQRLISIYRAPFPISLLDSEPAFHCIEIPGAEHFESAGINYDPWQIGIEVIVPVPLLFVDPPFTHHLPHYDLPVELPLYLSGYLPSVNRDRNAERKCIDPAEGCQQRGRYGRNDLDR